jgi:hypothetical protein
MIQLTRSLSRLASGFLLVLACGVGACDKQQITAPTPSSARRAVVNPSSDWRPNPKRVGESSIADVATRVPGFGGYYLSPDGSITVVVARDSDAAATIPEIQRLLSDSLLTRGWRIKHPPIRVILGRFSYRELSSWRDSISDNVLLAVRGVSWDAIDYASNSIKVGLALDAYVDASAAVLKMLSRFGVPLAAVEFQPVGGYLPGSGATVNADIVTSGRLATDDSLTSAASYLMGGLMVFGYGACTGGLYVDYTGHGRMLITDSHCTTTEFGVDGTTFNDASNTTTIGNESYDPAGFTCTAGGTTYTNKCRRSEQVLVSVTGSVTTRRGAIARTAGSPSNTWVAGGRSATLVRNSANPFFAVTAVGGGVSQGQTVYKIGRWSGWTYGTVTYTCLDNVLTVGSTNYLVQCNVAANTPAHYGDSGSPFFTWDGSCDCVQFLGIHNAQDTLNTGGHTQSSLYQPIASFLTDLGTTAINAYTDITVGTPSISGSVVSMCSQSIAHLSWSGVSSTNSPYTVTYSVYRSIDGGSWSLISYGLSGTGFDDCDQAVISYAGGTMPAGANVAYYIAASNAGVTSISNVVYFNP